MKICLDVFFRVNDLAIDEIPTAIKYMESGDHDSAGRYADDEIIECDTCESSFFGIFRNSEVASNDRNNCLNNLSTVNLDIIVVQLG